MVICQFFKYLQYEDVVDFGYCMFDCVFDVLGSSLDGIVLVVLDCFFVEVKLYWLEELLVDIVLGNCMFDLVVVQLVVVCGKCLCVFILVLSSEKICIIGVECGVFSFVNCCYLLFGDDIVGYFFFGKGIVVYCEECLNVVELCKLFECKVLIEWDCDVQGDYCVELCIEVINCFGVLVMVVVVIVDVDFNIENVEYVECDVVVVMLLFMMEVKSCCYLVEVICCVCCIGVVSGVYCYLLQCFCVCFVVVCVV